MFAAAPFAAAAFASAGTGKNYVDAAMRAPAASTADARATFAFSSTALMSASADALMLIQKIVNTSTGPVALSYASMAAAAWQQARLYAQGFAGATMRASWLHAANVQMLAAASARLDASYQAPTQAMMTGQALALLDANTLQQTHSSMAAAAAFMPAANWLHSANFRMDGQSGFAIFATRAITVQMVATGASGFHAVGVLPGEDEADLDAAGRAQAQFICHYWLTAHSDMYASAQSYMFGQAIYKVSFDARAQASMQVRMGQLRNGRMVAPGKAVASFATTKGAYAAADVIAMASARMDALSQAIRTATVVFEGSAQTQAYSAWLAQTSMHAQGQASAQAHAQASILAALEASASAAMSAPVQIVLPSSVHMQGAASVLFVPGNSVYQTLPAAHTVVIRPAEHRVAVRPAELRTVVRAAEARQARRD